MIKKVGNFFYIISIKFLQFFIALLFVLYVMIIFMALKDSKVLDYFL